MAAKLSGSGELRIILRHMAPSFLSHIIASMTLSIPDMILSETALSFLGLGLRPPIISWGVLLKDAQNVAIGGAGALALYPRPIRGRCRAGVQLFGRWLAATPLTRMRGNNVGAKHFGSLTTGCRNASPLPESP